MSTSKLVGRVILFEDPSLPGPDKTVAAVNCSAVKVVRCSNYLYLKDGEGRTVATITWPDRLKPREI